MGSAADIRPVVVGIDGSRAALATALWAVDEAIDRDVPLRLVYATGDSRPSTAPYDAQDIAVEYGETSLRDASAAVASTDKHVKVETEIRSGSATTVLVAESATASLVCVGSVGIGWLSGRILGSTAATLAETAQCPVVVVRYPAKEQPADQSAWIVVGIDDRPHNDQLLAHALDEARLRHAPVLAVAIWSCELGGFSFGELDQRVETWRHRHPDIRIQSAATSGGLPEFLIGYRDDVQLVVPDSSDANQVSMIIGPHGRPLIRYGQCSVMVVRS